MRLQYLSREAIHDIKTNFSFYKAHFSDQTNEWFINHFHEKNWLHESSVDCPEIIMNTDSSYSISDKENIQILHTALNNLSPVLAADERLWAGMSFTYFWNYIKYRRLNELTNGNEQEILNSFFFMRNPKRSCFIHCLSRLWWAGHLIYDKSNPNHYETTNLLCENAFASTIMLFSSSNFTSNKNIALGIFDCLMFRRKNGEKIGRYHYVESTKYLNSLGAITLLDMLSRKEVCLLVNNRLNKLYTYIEIPK